MSRHIALTAAVALLLTAGCAAASIPDATVGPPIGIINGFFIATDDEVRALEFEDIPLPAQVPSVEWKNMDPVKLGTLESILTDVPYDTVMDQGGMDAIFDGGQDGPFAFRVRAELRNSLAVTSPSRLNEVSAAWLETEEWQLQYGGTVREADVAEVAGLLGDLVILAAMARDNGANLFVLISL